jgi:hypothetical protein
MGVLIHHQGIISLPTQDFPVPKRRCGGLAQAQMCANMLRLSNRRAHCLMTRFSFFNGPSRPETAVSPEIFPPIHDRFGVLGDLRALELALTVSSIASKE